MADTKIWKAEYAASSHSGAAAALSEERLREAADTLRRGGLVAFPTETVYGLGADARSSDAVAGIFEAKGRPSDNPLIVHIAGKEQLDELTLPRSPLADVLMERFWPGPLTIVLPSKRGALSPLVTAGLPTVAVRMPDHPVALALLKLADCPVAAPSANRSGRPSPTTAEHVLEDLSGKIGGIVDGGATGVGLESTVVELDGVRIVRILRPGGITAEQLQAALPDADIVNEAELREGAAPRSPGMKYAHYAPRGELTLVQGDRALVADAIRSAVGQSRAAGLSTGVLAFAERAARYDADLVLDMGGEDHPEEAAKRLYAALREFDAAGIERIWAEAPTPGGIGDALLNRMAKAAGGRILQLSPSNI
ncbi:L-threonylcarbamoyladenylate synthase [Paenibacillus sp. LHD-117]|uniref:L-threonylcarbamoyladenylate synthase n=1 Tax=Paenibacillus sp. LHD-117 TaxID=3071412 RepID=UPI0027DFC97F|nr:L-threonylcarbamoyladenylate synthase [Paenibacillus sp. LHD-117]MDQ6420993.1 L-threonylcarbamoyladenylate synthase [Paenibacillus sp. LHD-117]